MFIPYSLWFFVAFTISLRGRRKKRKGGYHQKWLSYIVDNCKLLLYFLCLCDFYRMIVKL